MMNYEGSKAVVARAEVALHKSHCRGLCGFPCQEPKEIAVVYVTEREHWGCALEVQLQLVLRIVFRL